jgi:sigma-B regulation protein RsbU (phosphoserine phosphatase)
VLDHLLEGDQATGGEAAGTFVAPILVRGRRVGSIEVATPDGLAMVGGLDDEAIGRLSAALRLAPDEVRSLLDGVAPPTGPHRAASVRLLFTLAYAVARICYQEQELRQRFHEMEAISQLSAALERKTDLQSVLDMAARACAQLMGVKACAIRLIDRAGKELVRKAAWGLSEAYLNKGAVVIEQSQVFRQVMSGETVYVENLQTDPRTIYPDDARREGLVSALYASLTQQDRAIGAIQLYTGEARPFTAHQVHLVRSIAQQLASAITNAQLHDLLVENERVQRQIAFAADVQKRLLPRALPHLPPLDLAARYAPCNELGGDYYDLIELKERNLGIAIGDVVGKGVPAALLMASVRSALRAYAQDIYDLDEVLSRVNVALFRDTTSREFVTLFYGVVNPRTGRLTYSNAGHDAPCLVRGSEVTLLDVGGMVVGVDPEHRYQKGIVHLEPGDFILFYTDGLSDALNAESKRFDKRRVVEAARHAARLPTAQQALQFVYWEMRRHVGRRELLDDVTLVALKVDEKAQFHRK